MNLKTYERSIKGIIKLKKKPSKKEWNALAGKHGYLNTISLARLSGKNFTELCIDIRKKK